MSTDADVVVAGAGAAGMVAALRAARDQRQRVVVFEKSTRHGGNTQFSSGSLAAGGTRFQEQAGIEDSPQRHAADILAVSGDAEAADLVHAVCAAAPRYVAWLADELGHPLELGLDMPRAGQSVPRLHTDPARVGGELVVRTLRAAMARTANITFVDNTPVLGLLERDSGVTGVRVAEQSGTQDVTAGHVVLASDGFGNSPELLRQYCPEAVTAFYGGVSTSTGDAVRMGLAAGAAVRNMSGYLGHGMVVVGHGTRVNPNLPFLGALLVDLAGNRFCEETAQGYSKLAGILRRLPEQRAAIIWDEPAMQLAQHAELMRESADAKAYRRFDSVTDLADGMRLPAQQLGATLEAFSARSPLIERAEERLRAPWYATWITHGLLATQGGLAVDPAGRVVRTAGEVIRGLSAAGGAATGISGPSPDGYSSGNGLLAALGLGWIIGNRLAVER
jgi:fumarate reductase flavoprotein subunit